MGVIQEFRKRLSLALDAEIAESEDAGVQVYLYLVQQVWQVNHDITLDEIYAHAKLADRNYFLAFVSRKDRHQRPNAELSSIDTVTKWLLNSEDQDVRSFFTDEGNRVEWSTLFCELSTLKMNTIMTWRYGP